MKKTISFVLCVIMVMAIATCVFAKVPGGFKPAIPTDADQQAAAAVVAQISELPDKAQVTLKDKDAIVAARAAYDGLSDLAKGLVTNVNILTDAEAALAAIDKTGDGTMLFVALAMLSMTALVVMVSKKKAY